MFKEWWKISFHDKLQSGYRWAASSDIKSQWRHMLINLTAHFLNFNVSQLTKNSSLYLWFFVTIDKGNTYDSIALFCVLSDHPSYIEILLHSEKHVMPMVDQRIWARTEILVLIALPRNQGSGEPVQICRLVRVSVIAACKNIGRIRVKCMLRTYPTKYFPCWNRFNTLHTVCFMHRLPIYEVKSICHLAYFFIISYESFQHLTNFLDESKNRAKNVVIFSQLLSFNLTSNLFEYVQFICYPKLWQDTAWYILAIRRKLEFVFRINHILKNLMLKILRIYFYLMD